VVEVIRSVERLIWQRQDGERRQVAKKKTKLGAKEGHRNTHTLAQRIRLADGQGLPLALYGYPGVTGLLDRLLMRGFRGGDDQSWPGLLPVKLPEITHSYRLFVSRWLSEIF
jgi:hypothetical protein